MKKSLVVEEKLGIAGFFHVQLIEAKTGRVKFESRFRNLITTAGLNYIGSNNITAAFQYLGVGADSTAPALGQTDLIAPIMNGPNPWRTNATGGTADVDSVAGSPDYYVSKVRTRLFTELEANGNLAELGFFSAATGGTMWTRQLFKDDLGSPVVITKTNEDQLRVTYEVRIYPPIADVVVPGVMINGVSTTLTYRAVGLGPTGNQWSNIINVFPWEQRSGKLVETDVLTARDQNPSLSGDVVHSSESQPAYVNGNFYRDTIYVWDAGVANSFATGIGKFVRDHSTAGGNTARRRWEVSFNPKMVKTNLMKLTITSRISWAPRP
jgi:hypothetical protein